MNNLYEHHIFQNCPLAPSPSVGLSHPHQMSCAGKKQITAAEAVANTNMFGMAISIFIFPITTSTSRRFWRLSKSSCDIGIFCNVKIFCCYFHHIISKLVL
mmetsp:Transcript_4915/g.9789  ORF Transcript_4915/g.9789 Transcript_4915/m.9789 type:complete len:101 (+) Transcript_4915:3905-4207(+)